MSSRVERSQSPEPNIERVPRTDSGTVLGQTRARRQTRRSRASSTPPPAPVSPIRRSTRSPPQPYKDIVYRISNLVRHRIINGFNKSSGQGRYFGITEYSFFRDGLMSINYSTNVRDFGRDIRRQQQNRIKKIRKTGEELEPASKYQYTVYNSDPKFDINTQLTVDEILMVLRNDDLINILRAFGQFPNQRDRKLMLIQQIKRLLGSSSANNRDNYIRNYYSNVQQDLRRGRQGQRENPNEMLLVSNQYPYQMSYFQGMTMKQILQTLFDLGDHLSFLYSKVLRGNKIPKSREELIEEAFSKITKDTIKTMLSNDPITRRSGQSQQSYNTQLVNQYLRIAEPIIEDYCDSRSQRSDLILKENSKLILSILFANKNRFYLGPRPYTILNYQDETIIPTNELESQTEFDMATRNGIYIEYPMLVHITLTDKEPDKVTDADFKNANCQNQWQNVRKNWHEITSPNDVFERKYHKPIMAPFVRRQQGGRKKTKNNKRPLKNKTKRRK